jgi:hypothetical protein
LQNPWENQKTQFSQLPGMFARIPRPLPVRRIEFNRPL